MNRRESLSVDGLKSVILDLKYAGWGDGRGETLISPTLFQFAETFTSDLGVLTGSNISLTEGSAPKGGSIFLTIDTSRDIYLDVAGRESSEGYSLIISENGITLSGSSPLGAFWGARSILQMVATGNGTIPRGTAIDTPGWATRGVMLDVGRHYYPPEFLIEMSSYLSYFKQNTFHLHLSDSLVTVHNDDFACTRSLYSAFRLGSNGSTLAGLNRRPNESYTYEVFEDIQQKCAGRGVTIIPELESPGHALVITQCKPELALTTDYTLLGLTIHETIPTIQSIWRTVLPWFHSKTISIGADEVNPSFVSDYNHFVGQMSEFIGIESGKSVRIWGTYPPRPNYINIPTNVSIQHWAFFEDNPYFDYIGTTSSTRTTHST